MRVTVFEKNAPKLTFRFKKKLPGGGTTPYLLDGSPTIEMYIKDSPDDDDSNPSVVKYDSTDEISITDTGADPTDKYSEITVQTASADHATPRTRYFRVDVIKATLRETVADGFYEIKNI